MKFESNAQTGQFHISSERFQELMPFEVKEILLISSLYNIFNMEEDGSLTSKIINEYKGLNLTRPPRITGVSSEKQALALLKEKEFDMVLMVPYLEDTDILELGHKIKKVKKSLPVILIAHNMGDISHLVEADNCKGIDKIFIWSGNPDMLLALIKNYEDHANVDHDTKHGNVRVIILVEDSPDYYSYFLPVIYKKIVTQTRELLETSLNDNQKLLTMRARPKILLAKNYEEALELYRKYKSYLLCVISDTRLPMKGKTHSRAGIVLLSQIKTEISEIPLVLMSSEIGNKERAGQIPAVFLNKNSTDLPLKIHNFFLNHLGFGDFIFRMPGGQVIDHAQNLMQLEALLPGIPDESISYHADQDHFSIWLMARSEIDLGLKFRLVKTLDFLDVNALRKFIISNIHALRQFRQNGVVSKFNRQYFDPEVEDFVKISNGSLGGKARGLAFINNILCRNDEIHKKYPEINIKIPKTLVICTDIFEWFMNNNNLNDLSGYGFSDQEISDRFLDGHLPEFVVKKLNVFLGHVNHPLAIRSSSQLEDDSFQPCAGIYKTYKIPNNHPDLSVRLSHLVKAIKLVYASTCFEEAKLFCRNTSGKPSGDAMAVIVQELAGDVYGEYYYPSVSGVAQSYNYYPFNHMIPEDGIVNLTLGFGKTVVEGEKCLRFSPKYPRQIPQFSGVDGILKNTQHSFYALKIKNYPDDLKFQIYSNLEKRDIESAKNEFPLKTLSSTYVYEENRIRDTWHAPGAKVLTFAKLLKYDSPTVSGVISDLLELGKKSFGGPVEIEFALNLYPEENRKSDFYFLQIRPMVTDGKKSNVQITLKEVNKAFCYSNKALGNGINDEITDIVYVKPCDFRADATLEIAYEIKKINADMLNENRSYLLVGPGRWGSSDRWLGVPVNWGDISGAGAIVELRNDQINAEPSQGSHFFHNITSKGISYITINELAEKSLSRLDDYIDWDWINSLPVVRETTFLRHVRLKGPLRLKVDGRTSQCVMSSPIYARQCLEKVAMYS